MPGLVSGRPPSVNELYSFSIHHGTAQFEIGDGGLGTERSFGLDATLRHQSRRIALEVSAYATRIADYIYLDPTNEIVVTGDSGRKIPRQGLYIGMDSIGHCASITYDFEEETITLMCPDQPAG